MRDTLRKFGGVALGVPEPAASEETVSLPRPGRQGSTIAFERRAPTKVFDADAAIRRFDDIPTVNRDQVPFGKPRVAKGTRPAMQAQQAVKAQAVQAQPAVQAQAVQAQAVQAQPVSEIVVEPERSRPRCVLPQEVDVRYVLDAMRRAR
jgi:hypothetical protein